MAQLKVCQGDDLIIVPDGPLCLAPLSALSEAIRISTVPLLTGLKLILDSSKNCNIVKEVLLVGDPWLKDVEFSRSQPLPFAKEEVEMIGGILRVPPLTGREATKDEVMKRLKSAAFVHIASHGHRKTRELPCLQILVGKQESRRGEELEALMKRTAF